jgi:4-diphosphocytidyl-2-C-methyl-D-erythritol kinase
MSVTALAPAKVNLWLSVGPPGDDGYHSLLTVFHALDLSDEVTATEVPRGQGITITVEGVGADDVPTDSRNLVWRAAELLADTCDRDADVALHIVKRIPVAGGMAGGSADAAAALVACDALWRTELGRDRLMMLGAALGSDVPFAVHGGTAVGSGRGDHVMSTLVRGEFHWVVASAEGGLSTPAVYRELDRLRGDHVPPPTASDALAAALASGDPVALGRALGNDLQQAAVSLRPALARLLDAGDDAGALGGLVSGSGPTCVFLARDREHALDIAVELSGSGLCRSVACAVGAAPGTRVISRG